MVSTATGETSQLKSGGLLIFIGADAETDWLPPEIVVHQCLKELELVDGVRPAPEPA